MLTKAQKQTYLTKGGVVCPYCGSSNISAGYFDGEGLCQFVTCSDCGKEWLDIYKLVGIEEVKWGKTYVPLSDDQLPESIATDGSIAIKGG